MKKAILIIVTLFIFISLSNATLKAEEFYDISEYFPMDVGNKWVYQTYMLSREGLLDKTIISSVKSKETLNGKEVYLYEALHIIAIPITYISLDERGIYLHRVVEEWGEYTIFSSPLLFYPKYLQLNQKEFKASTSFKNYDPDGNLADKGTIKVRRRFEGVEDVTVPAGKFENCLRISVSGVAKTKVNLTDFTQTIWLAKGIGRVKELVNDRRLKPIEIRGSKVYYIELKNAIIKGNKIGNYGL